jgi:putative transposase
MKRERFTEEQIIGILKEHELGAKTADVCREHRGNLRQVGEQIRRHGDIRIQAAKSA